MPRPLIKAFGVRAVGAPVFGAGTCRADSVPRQPGEHGAACAAPILERTPELRPAHAHRRTTRGRLPVVLTSADIVCRGGQTARTGDPPRRTTRP